MSNLKHHNRVIGEIELISSHFGPVEFNNNIVLVEEFDLPRGFNRQTSKLLISLPDDYPEMPPEDLYIQKYLKKNGSTPEHYFENKYGDNNIMRLGYPYKAKLVGLCSAFNQECTTKYAEILRH